MDAYIALAELREKLLEWEHTYNNICPHQALVYLTPLKFLEQQKSRRSGVTNPVNEHKQLLILLEKHIIEFN